MASLATTSSPVNRIEELGGIIREYSAVTDRLQKSHDQLQQTVQSLRNDLAAKNRELERRNRLAALGEMAAGMAHEIRNPLGGIALYASLIGKDVADQPGTLKLVSRISAGVAHLERLVSQVLQFTREISANVTEADAAEIIDQAVELARPQFEAAGVRCAARGARPMKVIVDPMLLGQAALNLLLNAAEACEGGGKVSVSWRKENGRLKLVVADNGPGIPAALLDKIFNPFFTTKETGTGLGLAIVHRIVEAHDGAVAVRNGSNGGAEFELHV